MYADDLSMYYSFPSLSKAFNFVNIELKLVDEWLRKNKFTENILIDNYFFLISRGQVDNGIFLKLNDGLIERKN